MSWNYRVVKRTTIEGDSFEINEVYYNDDGSIRMMSEKGMIPYGNNKDELVQDLAMMAGAFDLPTLVEDEIEYKEE